MVVVHNYTLIVDIFTIEKIEIWKKNPDKRK